MHHPTDRITHTTSFVTPVVEHWLEREMAQREQTDPTTLCQSQAAIDVVRAISIPVDECALSISDCREKNVLFNDALNTFYLRLYGVRHMVKDHSDSEKANPLPPHRLLLSISSKGSFICTIPQTG